MSTSFKGPIYGDGRALGGAGDSFPVQLGGSVDRVYYFNDFVLSTDFDQTNDWTLTQETAGSADFVASETGVIRLDAPAQNQGCTIQLDGNATGVNIAITPAASVAGTSLASDAIMAARFALTDADTTDMFVGFAELNATSAVLTSAGALTSDNHAGFHLTNALNGVVLFSAAGTTDGSAVTVASVVTLADATFVDVAVRVTGTQRAQGYLRTNGTTWRRVANFNTTTAWNDQMLVTAAVIGDAAGDDLDLDFVAFSKVRDLTEPG